MIDASTSYIPAFSDQGSAKRTEMFLWSMLIVAVLDILLAIWIFRPWSHPETQTGVAASRETAYSMVVAQKPSPLGSIVREKQRAVKKAPVHAKTAYNSSN